MATTSSGTRVQTVSIGTTAGEIVISEKVKQIAVRNTHASQLLYIKVFPRATQAEALAAAAADVAVAGEDEVWTVPAGGRVVVFKSTQPRNVALSGLGSGATTTGLVEATPWFD